MGEAGLWVGWRVRAALPVRVGQSPSTEEQEVSAHAEEA